MLKDADQTKQSNDEEVQHYRVRLEILKRISTNLNSAMPIEEMLEKNLNLLQTYFPALRISYATIDSAGMLFVIHSTCPAGQSALTGLLIDLNEAPTYLAALRDNQIVTVDDLNGSALLAPLAQKLRSVDVAACLNMPLKHSEELIGLLSFDVPEPRVWKDYEAAILSDVAEHLTIAIRLAKEEQERKHAETALRDSEQRFRQIAENTADLFWLFDVHLRKVIYLGPKFEEIWGRTLEEAYENPDLFWSTIHPEDEPRVRTLMQNIRVGEVRAEFRVARPGGGIRWVRLRMFPVRNDANEIYRYAGLVQDITEHKLMDTVEREQLMFAEVLSETAEFLNSTLDIEEVFGRILMGMEKIAPAADLAIFWLISHGRADIIRHKAYTEIGRGWHIPENGLPLNTFRDLSIAVQTQKALAIPDVHEFEGWVVVPGNDTLLSVLVAPICLEGEVVGLLSLSSATPRTFQPIHAERLEIFASQAGVAIRNARLYFEISQHAQELEQRVAERTTELRLLNDRLQIILETTGEGIGYTEDRVIQYTNHAFTELVGYTADDLRGLAVPHITTLVADSEEAQRIMGALDTTGRTGGNTWRGSARLRRKDGTQFDAGITISWVTGSEPNITRAVILLRDISEEKSLQTQKDRFIANASHELRTPLTNIKLRLYLLGKQPERFAEHIRVVENVTESMRNLVEDLLDVSRFDRGIITLDRESIVLQDLVREVVNILSSNSEHEMITLTCELPDDPLTASIDVRRMRQVLTNLVVNALHYTPSGGSVTVRLQSYFEGDQEFVTIRVQDTGIGIAPEILPRIFEPFFRASEGGTSGTGLGLTISREIVELHGGTINVESQPGMGSTFSVSFPLLATTPE